MIAPSNLFSLLTKTLSSLTQGFRMFLAGSIVGTYGLVLYEVFPRYLFDINYSLYYFVIPVSTIASVLIALPKFLGPKDSTPKAQSATTEVDPLSEIIGEGSADAQSTTSTPEENLDISKIGGSNAELDALLAGGAPPAETMNDTVTTEVQPTMAAGFDETKIRELIDQKFEPVEKDLTTFKKDLNKIKEDMKITKESVDTLTESFEGTLTDMKAFQAEISNPLNFMRKYFEALDLTNLSDPSLPLKQGILQNAQTNQNNSQPANPPPQVAATQSQTNPVPIIIQAAGNNANSAQPQSSPSSVIRGSEMDRLVKGTDLDNPMNSVMKPLFSGNLSVANMMAIIELVGEMFAEKGEDCIDLLVEQCKLMGLKPEDEHTIYNIIDMLKNSGMSTEEAISQLYRFSKIVGLNDKEADAYYARMSAQKRPKREARD
ncbi:MAG TPA: hypothetical protein VNK25_00635 [Candidatus Nitrosotenuis sp.]|nr:hypothetical protein [Candidatus Nitrosotenuis sp.]